MVVRAFFCADNLRLVRQRFVVDIEGESTVLQQCPAFQQHVVADGFDCANPYFNPVVR